LKIEGLEIREIQSSSPLLAVGGGLRKFVKGPTVDIRTLGKTNSAEIPRFLKISGFLKREKKTFITE